MSLSKNHQYQAYSIATRTVPKTRQIVMLYDGTIKFIKQAIVAIDEGRIEARFNLLSKASEIMMGLAGSIDFENGGDIAHVLHKFYANMSMRILSVNFLKNKDEGMTRCNQIIEELKQMRDVWYNIDLTLNTDGSNDDTVTAESQTNTVPRTSENGSESGVILSA